jgi:hypothetical protein
MFTAEHLESREKQNEENKINSIHPGVASGTHFVTIFFHAFLSF